MAFGVTSQTHPILNWGLRRYLLPLGIEGDSLEAEPYGALECGIGEWWLRGPRRWSPREIDPDHPARGDFAQVLSALDELEMGVDYHGVLSLAPNPGTACPAAAIEALAATEGGWTVIRHTVHASQLLEAFIFSAAASLLASEHDAALFASGDDDAFCETVHRRLAANPG